MLKKLLVISLTLFALSAFGQKNLHLKISHKLGAQAFALNQGSTNNLGHAFNVSRLQYYISNIALIHDGGIITPVAGVYILANAADSTFEVLGSYAITNLEAVRFAIGVDAAKNHLDPSTYPASHPLAPKSPSMHWGWAAGYRFVAMEGKGGNSFSNLYEFHALDDANYFTQTISTSGIANGNDLIVSLVADYTQALHNISVDNGNVTHGSSGLALTLLENFNWRVFTSSEGNAAMATTEWQNQPAFAIYPNPSHGSAYVVLNNLPADAKLILFDALGKKMAVQQSGNNLYIGNLAAGLYVLQVSKNGESIGTSKLMINP